MRRHCLFSLTRNDLDCINLCQAPKQSHLKPCLWIRALCFVFILVVYVCLFCFSRIGRGARLYLGNGTHGHPPEGRCRSESANASRYAPRSLCNALQRAYIVHRVGVGTKPHVSLCVLVLHHWKALITLWIVCRSHNERTNRTNFLNLSFHYKLVFPIFPVSVCVCDTGTLLPAAALYL